MIYLQGGSLFHTTSLDVREGIPAVLWQTLAALPITDGHHASTRLGALLPPGADDERAQGPEDRDEVRPREGEFGTERRELLAV
jgi:hypothetical protein